LIYFAKVCEFYAIHHLKCHISDDIVHTNVFLESEDIEESVAFQSSATRPRFVGARV